MVTLAAVLSIASAGLAWAFADEGEDDASIICLVVAGSALLWLGVQLA